MRWFAVLSTLAVLGLATVWLLWPAHEQSAEAPLARDHDGAEREAVSPTLPLDQASEETATENRRAPIPSEAAVAEPAAELPPGRLQGRILDPAGIGITFADRYRIHWLGSDQISRMVEGVLGFGANFDTGEKIDGTVQRVEVRLASSSRWSAYAVDPIVVGRGELVEHDLTLPAQCEFHLRFRDAESGEPIIGARLEGLPTLDPITDEEGNVDITRIVWPQGEAMRFSLRHADYPPFRGQLQCPDPAWPVQREFAVPRGSSLSARVVDSSGAPVTQVQIHCSASVGASSGLGRREELSKKSTLVDAQGRFTLRGFQPGLTYRLRVQRDRSTILSEELVFPEASRRTRFVVHPPLSTGGLVLDADGGALPNKSVIALGPGGAGVSTATTDAQGSFELTGLFPGEWLAYVEYGDPFPGSIAHLAPRRIVSRRFRVDPSGAERVDLRLPPAAEPTVRVPFTVFAFDTSTHALIHDFHFFLNGVDSTLSERSHGGGGARGYPYSAPVGRYEVVVQAYGYTPAAIEIDLKGGDVPQRVEVWLAPYE